MFSAGPGPIKGGVYEYICDTGLDPVVPALVRGGVSVGVASRIVGEPGSFAGVFLAEELAESIFLRKVVVAFEEEGEAESPRLKKLRESTVNESAWLWSVVNPSGRARSYLAVCGEKASSRLYAGEGANDYRGLFSEAVTSTPSLLQSERLQA